MSVLKPTWAFFTDDQQISGCLWCPWTDNFKGGVWEEGEKQWGYL